MLGISKLDLFNDSDVIEEISFADLGLSCQTEIQYKKECVFDITALVPMILLLGPDPGSEHVFDVKVTDLAGQVTEQSLTFTAPALIPLVPGGDVYRMMLAFLDGRSCG